MADYHFYTEKYLGERIQEKSFPSLAEQAAGVLASYERHYQVRGGADARDMAICAMAECLQEHHRCCRHASASVGNTSVHYRQPRLPLEKQLYQAAGIYLDIYRGVK